MTPSLVLADSPTDPAFGHDTWWLILLKAVVIFILLVVLTLFNIWYERRVVARMQVRLGPNRHGPFGLLQSLADGLKLALKEDINTRSVDRIVFWLAPVISTFAAFTAFAVIPFGPVVSIFGHKTPLQLADFPVAALFVLAMSSLGIYGIVLAGWSSSSPYPLLGGMRSAAQMISYEVAMGLSWVTVFMVSGSLWTSQIVEAQQDLWMVIQTAFVPFAIYAVAMVGETNRAPFDLPEAEGELVGGYHTEYSSLKFALFFLAEYINMTTVTAVAVTLYLGGWRAPWPISLWDSANTGWWPLLWFFGKVLIGLFVFIWLRGTLPRLRYDQFMQLGWKLLIPVSLVWVLLVAAMRYVSPFGNAARVVVVACLLALLIGALTLWERSQRRKQEAEEIEDDEYAERIEADPMSAGFPVPSLDLPHLRDVPHREVTPRG